MEWSEHAGAELGLVEEMGFEYTIEGKTVSWEGKWHVEGWR